MLKICTFLYVTIYCKVMILLVIGELNVLIILIVLEIFIDLEQYIIDANIISDVKWYV